MIDATRIPEWYETKCKEIIAYHERRYGNLPDLEEMSMYIWSQFLDTKNLSTNILIHFKAESERELKSRRIKSLELNF